MLSILRPSTRLAEEPDISIRDRAVMVPPGLRQPGHHATTRTNEAGAAACCPRANALRLFTWEVGLSDPHGAMPNAAMSMCHWLKCGIAGKKRRISPARPLPNPRLRIPTAAYARAKVEEMCVFLDCRRLHT